MSFDKKRISKITAYFSISSFLMNFSATAVVVTSLNIFENLSDLVIVKTLSQSLGYIGKFLVGFLTDSFNCNSLVLKIGYGSNFIIKPMFYLSCFGLQNFLSLIGIHIDYDLHFVNIVLFVIADALDQICNQFRDIARDVVISQNTEVVHLSSNLYFRKSAAFLGTALGGGFAFLSKVSIPYYLHVVMIIALITSIFGYALLVGVLRRRFNTVESKFDDIAVLKDTRFVTIVMFVVGCCALMLSKYLLVYFVIGVSLCVISYFLPRSKTMPVCSNKSVMFIGILTCFMFMFHINKFALLKMFNFTELFNIKKDIARQVFFLFYYGVSFCSSFIASLLRFSSISKSVVMCSTILLLMYLMSIIYNSMLGFIIAVVCFGMYSGLYEPSVNSYVVKSSKDFNHQGIVLGFFSLFGSVGIIMNAYFLKNFTIEQFSQISVAMHLFIIILVLLYFLYKKMNNCK